MEPIAEREKATRPKGPTRTPTDILSMVKEELDRMIREWLADGNGSRSVSDLSRLSGIADTTLRRIMNSSSLPNMHNILCLLSYFANSKDSVELMEYLRAKSPILVDYIDNHSSLPKGYLTQVRVEGINTPAPPLDKDMIVIYVICLDLKRVRQIDIIQKFGEAGEVAVRGLLDKQLVRLSSDGVLEANFQNFITSRTSAYFLMQALHETFFRPTGNKGLFELTTGGVSEIGLAKADLLLKEFGRNMRALYKTDPGDRHLYMTSVVDTMDFKDFETESRETV